MKWNMNGRRIREGHDLGCARELLSGLRAQLRLEILLDEPIFGGLLHFLTVVSMRLEESDAWRDPRLRVNSADTVFQEQGNEDTVSSKLICPEILPGQGKK